MHTPKNNVFKIRDKLGGRRSWEVSLVEKEKNFNIHIYGISKSELEKLKNMSKKNGYTSLNSYLQFLLRREIENDLVNPEKVAYKNYFESMRSTLLTLGKGYIQAAKRKETLLKYFSKMVDLVDEWLYLTDSELEGFAEDKELLFDKNTGIVSEKLVQKIITAEKIKTATIDESPKKVIDNTKQKHESQKRIEIRGLSSDDIASLKLLSKHAKAANLNQYMLDQVYLILKNGGLDIYDNRLADDILDVKKSLSKISEQQTRQELHDMEIISKLNVNIELMINWIKFINLAQTDQL